jgi:serine/threonine protein kinase
MIRGGSEEAAVALQDGSNFGPYRIMGPLGRGGMASVYRAYEPGLDRYVALKVLPPEFLQDPDFAERFRREARVIAKLEHPNIIPIYAFDIEGGTPWMAMRLIAGGALSAVMKAGPLPEAENVSILRGVAEALDYAHGQGVIHRDVKPQNILLDPSRQHIYLADFGIAKMIEGSSGLTQTGMISGTPQYMAPEQATGKTLDHRADIYALGVVAYEMFTGHAPFAADTPVAILMKHVSEPIPLPKPGEVPEQVVRALLKSLAKNPEERWPSATAFVAALAQATPDLISTRSAPPVAPTAMLRGGTPATGTSRVTRPSAPVTPGGVPGLPPEHAPTAVGRATAVAAPPPPTAGTARPGAMPPPAQAAPPVSRRSGPSSGLIVALVVGLLLTGTAVLVGAYIWFIRPTPGGDLTSLQSPSPMDGRPTRPTPPSWPSPSPAAGTAATPVGSGSPAATGASTAATATAPTATTGSAVTAAAPSGSAQPTPTPPAYTAWTSAPPPTPSTAAATPPAAATTTAAPPITFTPMRPAPEPTPTPKPVAPTVPVATPTPVHPAVTLPPATMPPPTTMAPPPPTHSPRPTTPPAPPGPPFSMGKPIKLGDKVEGPLTYKQVKFKFSRGELSADLDMHVAKGHDLNIDVEVTVYDEEGTVLATLAGKDGIEEGDDGTITAKKKVPEALVKQVAYFRVTATPTK